MSAIMSDPKFKLANIVLSQKSPFTLPDIVEGVKKAGLEQSESVIKKSLDFLRDSGIIIKHGSRYSLSIRSF